MNTHPSPDVIRQTAAELHMALPAFNIPYLPMMEPVTKAIADEDSFALIEVARLEFIKFEAKSQAAIKAEFDKWHAGAPATCACTRITSR